MAGTGFSFCSPMKTQLIGAVRRIPFRLAFWMCALLLDMAFMFHIGVLIGLMPYDVVWGGQLGGPAEGRGLVRFSMLTCFFLLVVVMVRGGIIPIRVPPWAMRMLLTLIAVLFLLNTFGNLLASSGWERLLAIPTLLLAVSAWRLAVASPTETIRRQSAAPHS